MRMILALIGRDLGRNFKSGGFWLAILFFLLVAVLYPFAVGPDARLLARTGGGVLWIAALLAALLPIDQLIAPDAEAGVLDQLVVRGVSEEGVGFAKLLSHWLAFGPALMVAAVPASALMHLDLQTFVRLEAGLALGTPALAALGLIAASLTSGLRGTAALNGLITLPLAIPVLIFGAGSLTTPDISGLKWLAAVSLVLVGLAPFAVGLGLRAARS